jgi:CcmD family protein
MQTGEPKLDPTKPPDLEPSRSAAVPPPAQPTAPPNGIADVSDDPGLAPGVITPKDLPKPSALSPEERSTEFVSVEGGDDTTSAEALLVTAYALMWVMVLAFVFFSWRRQQRIEGRLAELEKQLREGAEAR